MSASGFDAVKLISLDILDFKKLQRGKVSWEYRVETKFGVVNVQSFDGKIFLGIFSRKLIRFDSVIELNSFR